MTMYPVGFAASYIQDYPFEIMTTPTHVGSDLVRIPDSVAVMLVKQVCPDLQISAITAREMTAGNENPETDALACGWPNRKFVVIANDGTKALAISRKDWEFVLYQSKPSAP